VFNALPRFNLTVDAYQIRIKDRILLSSTLQGSTVIGVLQAAGITSSAGASISPTRPTRARAGSTSWHLQGRSGQSWHRQPQPFGQFQQDGLHPRRCRARRAGRLRSGADRARPQGDFTLGTPRNKFIANVAWEKGPAALNLRATRYGSVTQVNASATGPMPRSTPRSSSIWMPAIA
jgi:iron complex outermembrane receptor protein